MIFLQYILINWKQGTYNSNLSALRAGLRKG